MKIYLLKIYLTLLCLLIIQHTSVDGKALHWKINKIKQLWPLSLYFKDELITPNPPHVIGHVVEMAPKYPVWKIHKYDGVQLKPVSTIPIFQIKPVPNLIEKHVQKHQYPSIEEVQHLIGAESPRETLETLKEYASTETGRKFMSDFVKTHHPGLEISDKDIGSVINQYELDLLNRESIHHNNPFGTNLFKVSSSIGKPASHPHHNLMSQGITNEVLQTVKNIKTNALNVVGSISGWHSKNINSNNILNYQQVTPTKNVLYQKPIVPYQLLMSSNNKVVKQDISNQVVQSANIKPASPILVDDSLQQNQNKEILNQGFQQIVYKPINTGNQNIHQQFVNKPVDTDSQNIYQKLITREMIDRNGRPLISMKYDYPNFSYIQLTNTPAQIESSKNVILHANEKIQDNVPREDNPNVSDASEESQNIKLSSLPIYVIPESDEESKQFDTAVPSSDISDQSTIKENPTNIDLPHQDHGVLFDSEKNPKGKNGYSLQISQDKTIVNGRPVNSLSYSLPNLSYTQLSEIPLSNSDFISNNGATSYEAPISGKDSYEYLVPAASEEQKISIAPDSKKNRPTSEINKEPSKDASIVYAVTSNLTNEDS